MGKNWAGWGEELIRIRNADNQVTKGVGRLTERRDSMILKTSKKGRHSCCASRKEILKAFFISTPGASI
jgi:hypothetical protein